MNADVHARFEHYLNAVTRRLRDDPRVVGLVAMGSTAERHRVDEWSDHDLAIVTLAGYQEELRHERGWLPDAEHLVLDVIEWHGGGKLIFDDGRVVEFGVATAEELSGWSVHHHDVLFDRGGVAEAVALAVARSPRNADADLGETLAIAVAHTHIGAGKAARGELLAASTALRGDAVTALATAVAIISDPDARADYLDPRRRLEQTHPEVARALAEAMRLDELALARRLLEIAEQLAGDRAEFPRAAVDAVRRRHGWSTD
ncbi:hypothetical protein [Microcella sp.]|uniref:hypothetical protein n=1 Tax=Microcella sp. TaxID=1913979 RepID=UPI00256463BC|nr:hypothetical protein [Microcella sp.]MBX9470681.1 hypothetical protein [Microcella sp.]